MSKIPSLKSKQVIRVLQKVGFIRRRQTGSHLILKNKDTNKIVPIPIHTKELKRGLIFSIIKQAEMTTDEFLRLLRK